MGAGCAAGLEPDQAGRCAAPDVLHFRPPPQAGFSTRHPSLSSRACPPTAWSSVARPTYDAIIVGLGAMGSAAAYQLARRGKRVLGLDAFPQGHTLGSSHGETRIIRMAYFEHPDYVPLLRRAYELWEQTEAAANTKLLHLTGGVFIGPPDGDLVAGSLRSAQTYGLPHALLDADEIRRRFPMLRPRTTRLACSKNAPASCCPSGASKRISIWPRPREPSCATPSRSFAGQPRRRSRGGNRAWTLYGREPDPERWRLDRQASG